MLRSTSLIGRAPFDHVTAHGAQTVFHFKFVTPRLSESHPRVTASAVSPASYACVQSLKHAAVIRYKTASQLHVARRERVA